MIHVKELHTASNYMSILRMLLAIPLWFMLDELHSGNMRYYIFGLCVFGAITDILDGYLARKYQQETEMGRIIDPLADKVVIGIIVLKLFLLDEISPLYFFLIIGRDLIIFIGGMLLSQKIGRVLPSNVLGKAAVINIGIVLLLILLQVDQSSVIFAGLYYLSIILIIASFLAYALRAIEFLRRKEYGSV
jgi:cardiolipin synthase (CMP-forming)